MNLSISEENQKLSQQLNPQEVGSLARGSPRTKGAAGNCWREHFKRFEMMTPEEQLRTVSERAGFVRTVSKGMYYKTGEDVDDGFWGILLQHAESTLFLGHIQILEQNFGYTITQSLVLFLMSTLSVITTFMESRFRSPQHLETKQKFGWSYPAAQIVTKPVFLFIKEFGEDLPANAFSHRHTWDSQVSKFVSKLVRHEHSRKRETYGAIHWKFKSPKLKFKFRSDGGSNFTDRDWINFIWKRKQQKKIPVLSEFLQQITVHSSHSRTHKRRNDSNRDAGPRPHTSQVEGVCVPSRVFIQFDIHIECWTHRRRKRRS